MKPTRKGHVPSPWMLWVAGLLLVGCSQTPHLASHPASQSATGDWVAAWGSAQLAQSPPVAAAPAPAAILPMRDVTLRQVLRVTAEGVALRVRVSNLFGAEPLQIGSATVARIQSVAVAPTPAQQAVLQADTLRALTFGGQRGLTVAPGAEVWSDAVELAVPRLGDLAVQVHVVAGSSPATVHPGSRINSWAVAGNRVDAAVWADPTPREGWWYLAAVDVRTDPATTSEQPVLVATGDSITDGYGVPSGSNQRWTDTLARRMVDAGRAASVVNTGIGGGRLLRDGQGPRLISRFDRDVLDRTGVTHAVVLIGINDLGASHRERATTPESRAGLLAEMKAGFTALADRAHARGVCLIAATVLPYGGSGFYKPQPENEVDRVALNEWIRQPGRFNAVLDFDALLRDPARPTHLRADLDNDGLHPSLAGYRAMADAFPLDVLARRCGSAARIAAATWRQHARRLAAAQWADRPQQNHAAVRQTRWASSIPCRPKTSASSPTPMVPSRCPAWRARRSAATSPARSSTRRSCLHTTRA